MKGAVQGDALHVHALFGIELAGKFPLLSYKWAPSAHQMRIILFCKIGFFAIEIII